MTISTFGRRLYAALTLTVIMAASVPSSAQAPSTYQIAAASGYGVEECLAEGGECGRAVADAWCAANGRGAALEFGRATLPPRADQAPYFVTCGD